MNELSGVWSGVDYVRATYEGTELEDAGGAQGLWISALQAAGLRAETARAGRWLLAGFEGWQVSGVGVATDVTGRALVQVPGASAGDFVRATPAPSTVSRIDIQITGLPPVPAEEWINQDLAALLDREKNWNKKGRAPKVWYVVSDSTTVYSGKRSSRSLMMRLYNSGVKHADKGVYFTGTVRYEVEAGREAARRLYTSLRAEEFDPQSIAARVVALARGRGSLVQVARVDPVAVDAARAGRVTNDGSTLAWLRRQVAPAIRRLQENGTSRKAVLEALGLESDAGSVDF